MKNWFIESRIESLERRYNPERDLIPGAPDVTFTDAALLEMIKLLVNECDDLRSEIEKLKSGNSDEEVIFPEASPERIKQAYVEMSDQQKRNSITLQYLAIGEKVNKTTIGFAIEEWLGIEKVKRPLFWDYMTVTKTIPESDLRLAGFDEENGHQLVHFKDWLDMARYWVMNSGTLDEGDDDELRSSQIQPGRKVSHAELVIMSLVAKGFSSREIAQRRHVESTYPGSILNTLSKVLECERNEVLLKLKEIGALQPNNEINFDYLYPKLEVRA